MELPRQRPVLPALTTLRFYAAFVVVAFHYNPERFVNLPGFFRSWLETGYEAVTFFFVLSGFIMSYMYSDYGEAQPRKLGGRAFFVARFARLAPAYYVGLLVALPILIAELFIWSDEPRASLLGHSLLVAGFLQSWWPPAALAWNPPGWSVSVEWCLYACFPLLAAMSRRWSGRTMLWASFGILAVVAGFRLRVLGPLVEDDPETWHNFAQYFPLFHVPTFFFGMALGRMQLTGPRPSPRLALALSLGSILILMVKFSGLIELPRALGTETIHALIFGALIVGAAQPDHPVTRLLSLAPGPWLGEISYSLYVLHEPIMFWWEALWPAVGGDHLPVWMQFPSYFAVVILLSAACYHWVEGPLRRRLRRWLGG